MNRQRRMAGLIFILGLMLGFGIWQQRSQAAGPNRQGVQQVASSATFNGLASPALRSVTAAPMATITVQSLGDGAANAANCPGVNCRLRDAIAKTVEGDTIAFSVTGTIILTSGELAISKSLTIQGPGATQLTISGNQASRVFNIDFGLFNVTLSGLTIANGRDKGADGVSVGVASGYGGGIVNSSQGTVNVTNCMIVANSAIGGSGLGSATHNRGQNGTGGGIDTAYGTMNITNSSIMNNSAIGGSAIAGVGGNSNNIGTEGFGGGIFLAGGTVNLINSTLSGNSAIGGEATGGLGSVSVGGNAQGGGIYIQSTANRAALVRVINSTLSGNSVKGGNAIGDIFAKGGQASGGGIVLVSADLTVTGCTLSSNSAIGGSSNTNQSGIGYAGGLIIFSSAARLRNTIIAGNSASVGAADVSGEFVSLGNNLLGNDSGAIFTPTTGDLIGTAAAPINPLLAPLGNYGGVTQTYALLPGSPAINAGNNCVLTNSCASDNLGFNLTTDQRGAGFNRKVGSAVDIGAFESRGFTLAIAGGDNQSAVAGSAFALPLSVTVSSANSEPVNGGQVTFTPPASGASASIAGNPATIVGSTATSGTLTSNTIQGGGYTVTASANGATAIRFSLTNFDPSNTAPMFTPAAAISLEQGSNYGVAIIIGTVSDAETSAGSLTVTNIAGGTATGIFPYNIHNFNGTIYMNVAVECTAASGTVRFQVSDGTLTNTGDLAVTVTAHVVPTLTYGNVSVGVGASTTNSPTITGNSSFNGYSVQSKGTYTGTISVDVFGVVSISGAAPVGTHTITIRATVICGATTDASFLLIVDNALQFYPLAHPVRLLDTRAGQTGCDSPGAMIAGGTARTQTAAGRTCDGLTIPANARALTGNITTVESGGGFLTLFPSDITRPLVANSNFAANQVLNNVFTVGLGAGDGAFNIYVTTNTNVVVDITGYYAPPSVSGLYFHPLPKPVRLLDTRVGQSACFTPGAPLTAGATMTQLGTTTCDGVLIPAGAQSLVGNATTVNSQANGFLTLFPADATKPLAASSNFQTGVNMNAPFSVGLSPSGQFNIYTLAQTDLVVDVLGYYSTQLNDSNGQGLLFYPLSAPVRLLDTRAGQTGCFTPGTPMAGNTEYLQAATGTCTTIPATAKAVVGNATTVNVTANGFLRFWPSDAIQPSVATSNYQTGRVFNRHFTVGLGPDAAFKRYASSTTDLIIDISGFFAP